MLNVKLAVHIVTAGL